MKKISMLPKESMVSIRESWKNLKGYLLRNPSECTICLSAINKPAKLTCGHRFCESCIGEYWQLEFRRNHVVCPLCQALVTDITFIEEESARNQSEFRKEFDINQKRAPFEFGRRSVFCMKIGLMFPIMYYTVQYLKDPIIDIFRSFQ